MAQKLTRLAQLASQKSNVELQIVLEIEGISTVFGAKPIEKYLQYGDDYVYGDDIVYGGTVPLADQMPYISMSSGTSTKITQIVRQDKGEGESIASVQIAIIDKNNEVSAKLGDFATTELLGTRAKVWMGFEDTAFRQDYICIFRGYIDQINVASGQWLINVIHSDSKRRANVFLKSSSQTTVHLSHSDTIVTVSSTANFLSPKLGPTGTYDAGFESLIRIEDEIIKFTSKTSTQFQGCTRGYLGTTAAVHDINSEVSSGYRIRDNPINIALKLSSSKPNVSGYLESVQVTNYNRVTPTQLVPNAIFFAGIDLISSYNIRVGDFVSSSGASHIVNNFTLKQILDVQENDYGSYIVVSDVSLVEELSSSGQVSFRSGYDVYPDGLSLSNDEIDFERHEFVRDYYLPYAVMDFYLEDQITGKEFISSELFNPLSCYSIPRDARVSLGFHTPPLPTQDVKIFDLSNTKNATQISISRSLSKNFYNTITVKYDPSHLDKKFQKGYIRINNDSLERIKVGYKALALESNGLRSVDGADALLQAVTQRRMKKYKFAAESIKLSVLFKDGFNLDIDDVILVDLASLGIFDQYSVSRFGESRLFEITNKELDLKTGDVGLELTDTNFDKDSRYCLISKTSEIAAYQSQTTFSITTQLDGAWWVKWLDCGLRVRDGGYIFYEDSYLKSVSDSTITVQPAYGSVSPSAGRFIEFSPYDLQTQNVKLVYGFMRDTDFSDSKPQYRML